MAHLVKFNQQLMFNVKEKKIEGPCHLRGHIINILSPCHPCLFGGDCSERKTKARPNYWGFKENGHTRFQSCPLGYCCNNIDVKCQTYDTCGFNRRGRLCGECEPSYTESPMSKTYVPDGNCKDWWIWSVGLILAFNYLIWYMYKGELFPMVEFPLLKIYSFKSKRNSVIHTKSQCCSRRF